MSFVAQYADGQVCWDVSTAAEKTAGVSHDWDAIADASARGGEALQMLPELATRYSPGDADAPSFAVQAAGVAAGSHTLWYRGRGPTPSSDSFFVRLNDGEWITSNSDLDIGYGWHVAGSVTTVSGVNTITVSGREDGTVLDGLLLIDDATDPNAINGGLGPAASAAASSGSPLLLRRRRQFLAA